MSYFEECLKKFEELPVDFRNKIGSLESFEKIELIEKEYGIDLKFFVILLAIGELSLYDAHNYLQVKYDLAEEDAYEIRNLIINDIFELTAGMDLTKDVSEYSLKSPKEVLNIFRERLAEILNNNNEDKNESIDNLNKNIFNILSENGLLQDSLTRALFENQEIITSDSILIEGKKVDGTISNWLKDFVKINSGEFFDDIVLAQYLTSSENIKKLSIEEKNIVRKLLKLYRNIGFFPDSMQNMIVEDWQIIPVDRIKSNKKYIKDVLSDEKIGNKDKNSKELLKTKAKQVLMLDSSKKINQENVKLPNNDLVSELRIMLQDYSESSLEYKTIQQEIKRLENKK